jgi:excisionase family DNA binding protein
MTDHPLPLIRALQAEADRRGIDRRYDIVGLAGLRVSGKALAKLKTQMGVDLPVPGLPEWLVEHGPKIVVDAAMDLAAAGLIRVVERDLAPAHLSRARVGYIGFVEAEPGKWWIIIAVASSGAKMLLPSKEVPGGLSAWALLVTWTWDWAKSARALRFVRDDRMSRDLEVFAPINGAVQRRRGAAYWWGSERIDPRKDNWRAVIGAAKSADGRRATTELTTGGRATAWQASEWTEKEEYLPLGLHLPETVDEHGVTVKSKRPAVDPAAAQLAQLMWKRAAQGWDMTDIAVDAAAAGLRNGRGALLAPKVAPLMNAEQLERTAALAAELPEQQQCLVTAALADAGRPRTHRELQPVRRAASEAAKRVFQYLEFYRSGRLSKLFTNALPGETVVNNVRMTFLVEDERDIAADVDPDQVHTITDFQQAHPQHPIWKVRAEDPDRFEEMCLVGFYDGVLELPTPVSLTDEQWEAAERAVPPRWLTHRRTGHAKRQSAPTAPLSQLQWIQDDLQWRIWQDHGRYLLLTGPVGAPVAQLTDVAGVRCAALHRALGDECLRLAGELDDAPAPLPILLNAPTVEAVDPGAVAEARVAHIERQIEDEKNILRQLTRQRAASDEMDDPLEYESICANIEEAKAKIREFMQDLKSAHTERANVRTAAPEAERTDGGHDDAFTIDVDANPLVVIGARLQELADTGSALDSPQMSTAIAWLVDNGELLRCRLGDGRDVHLDVRLRLPGRDVPQEIEGFTLTLTRSDGGIRGRQRNTSLPTLREEAARWTLRDLNGEAFRQQHGWTLGFLAAELRAWLKGHGFAPGAVNAIIDNALIADPRVPVAPIIYTWATTAGSAAERLDAARSAAARQHVEQMADPIIDAYIHQGAAWPERGTGWVRRPLADVRRLVALVAAQGRKVPRRDLAQALSLGYVRDDGAAVDALTALRNLARIDSPLLPVGMDQHDMWTEPCTRPRARGRCTGRMTTVVAVPETILNGALLACDRCYRPAGEYWTKRPLPIGWQEPWDAPTATVNLMEEAGRSFITRPADTAHLKLAEPTYTVTTAASKLHIGPRSVERLIDDGVIRAAAVVDDRGGWRIPAREVERAEVVQAAAALRERRYPPTVAA